MALYQYRMPDGRVHVFGYTPPPTTKAPMTTAQLAIYLRDAALQTSTAHQAIAAVIDPETPTGQQIAMLEPILSALLSLAADIADSGQDPLPTIARIADAKPWLANNEAEWAARLAGKFGV